MGRWTGLHDIDFFVFHHKYQTFFHPLLKVKICYTENKRTRSLLFLKSSVNFTKQVPEHPLWCHATNPGLTTAIIRAMTQDMMRWQKCIREGPLRKQWHLCYTELSPASARQAYDMHRAVTNHITCLMTSQWDSVYNLCQLIALEMLRYSPGSSC